MRHGLSISWKATGQGMAYANGSLGDELVYGTPMTKMFRPDPLSLPFANYHPPLFKQT